MVLCYLYLLGDVCPGVDDTELTGTDIICPDRLGFFRCTTTNSVQLLWIVEEDSLLFSQINLSEDRLQGSNTEAHLLDISVGNPISNRTSVLIYTPDAGTRDYVDIICRGQGINTCTMQVLVIGKSIIKESSK